jgi:hypothetical protein
MSRKQIVVPKNAAAQAALLTDSASPEQLLEVTLSGEEFRVVWDSGVLEAINRVAHCLIDDFEDEHIEDPDALLLGLTVIDGYLAAANEPLATTLRAMRRLFEEAIERKTGVHFYF